MMLKLLAAMLTLVGLDKHKCAITSAISLPLQTNVGCEFVQALQKAVELMSHEIVKLWAAAIPGQSHA